MSVQRQLVLFATALVVAALGWTPLGEAAREAVFPANSVGTAQLQDNAVLSAKIRNGSVAAMDVQLGSLTGRHGKDGTRLAGDFTAGLLPAGPTGDKGDKGSKGDKGDKGATGSPGVSAYEVVRSAPVLAAAGATVQARATCLGVGKRPLGGGAHRILTGGGPVGPGSISSSLPDGNQWVINYVNGSTSAANIYAYAICATVSP